MMAEIPIVVTKLKDHDQIKPQLLQYIDEMPDNSIRPTMNTFDSISKTDWDLREGVNDRKYLDFIKPIIVNAMHESFRSFRIQGLHFEDFWFQQYYRSDTHGMHVHSGCHWSNVYFVELPNSNVKTDIMAIGNTKLIDYEASEGDIVSFPSMLYHGSPPNPSNERKTIISFNSNFV
jgi:hypothetical protein